MVGAGRAASESAAGLYCQERAIELGVPASAVVVEPRARNTGENIRFSRELLCPADRQALRGATGVRHGEEAVARRRDRQRFDPHDASGPRRLHRRHPPQ
ncbi:YdcF family protein [Streptomyces sp. NPDC004266]|uniref:YdcF family protein n=1 Tax=Streptomyces sp. NPDC004266 TaxID=3364693 RepID=UPI0036C4439A